MQGLLLIKINPAERMIVKTVEDIFDLKQKTNTSKFTKAYVNEHKGNIPVYSASKDAEAVSYGYVQDNLSSIKYF